MKGKKASAAPVATSPEPTGVRYNGRAGERVQNYVHGFLSTGDTLMIGEGAMTPFEAATQVESGLFDYIYYPKPDPLD